MSSSALPAKAARSLRTFKADRSRSVANTPAANPMGRADTGGVIAVSVMLKAAVAVRPQAAAGHNSTAGRHVSARTFEPFAAGAGQLSFLGFDHSFESGGDVGSALVLQAVRQKTVSQFGKRGSTDLAKMLNG